MRLCGKILCVLSVGMMCGCAFQHERTYYLDDVPPEKADEYSALPCMRDGKGGFLDSRLWSNREVSEVCAIYNPPAVTRNGMKYCHNKRRCSEEAMLPYQPCMQPMPTYYSDISATETQEGILLQHPVTRTQVLCYDLPSEDAVTCAQNFMASGYVLITDIPQVSANYDVIRPNSYPTRKWRNGGEYVPRW